MKLPPSAIIYMIGCNLAIGETKGEGGESAQLKCEGDIYDRPANDKTILMLAWVCGFRYYY